MAKAKSSNKIVDVLMERDGMTKQEAEKHLNDVREMINDAAACGDYDDVEDIMYSELGLEMDYIFDILM